VKLGRQHASVPDARGSRLAVDSRLAPALSHHPRPRAALFWIFRF